MPAYVNSAKCTGCEKCEDACPVDAITMKNDKALVAGDKCVECETCIGECPSEAITIK
ncbi:MAG TPA: 4Fe-4S binding protein [Victivallales bacterium]|nr:4Fe-4S binding protein [Victivallales bacterium]